MNQQQRQHIGDELFIEELTLVAGGAGQTTTAGTTVTTRQHGEHAPQSLSSLLGADTVEELPAHLQPLFENGPTGIRVKPRAAQR